MIHINDITGLILAGGRGSRMGGVDKGLQHYLGLPMASHALRRLSPQVGNVMITANRNVSTYEAMGVPVWSDNLPDFSGPLAGLAAGLSHCKTEYLVTVPCDCPQFPLDLVQRLAAALDANHGEMAMVVTHPDGKPRTQPVFCMMKASLLPSLLAFLESGQRKIEAWTSQRHCINVHFDDAYAFRGANTLAELQALPS